MEVDIFVLYAAPQALDKHVVDPSTLAVHADLHSGQLERIDPFPSGKLGSLVRVGRISVVTCLHWYLAIPLDRKPDLRNLASRENIYCFKIPFET